MPFFDVAYPEGVDAFVVGMYPVHYTEPVHTRWMFTVQARSGEISTRTLQEISDAQIPFSPGLVAVLERRGR